MSSTYINLVLLQRSLSGKVMLTCRFSNSASTSPVPWLDWHFLPGPTPKHKGTYIKGTIGTCFNIAARLSGRLVGLEPSGWRTIGRNEAHVVLDLGGFLVGAYVNVWICQVSQFWRYNSNNPNKIFRCLQSLDPYTETCKIPRSILYNNTYRKVMSLQATMHWPGLTRL